MLGRGWACDRGFAVFCKNRMEGYDGYVRGALRGVDLSGDIGMYGVWGEQRHKLFGQGRNSSS